MEYILNVFERGSPSLVGRGIANPMFERTRGFESHSPRLSWGFLQKCYKIDTRSLSLDKQQKEKKGDHYIKKIIQIPISLSEWNDTDVKQLLQNFLDGNVIDKTYHDIIKENLDLISKAVEFNPREVKRFLNNFIVAYEIFSKGKDIELKDLLVIQAIQVRWNSFYHLLVKYVEVFSAEIKKYIDIPNEERIKKIESEDKDEKFDDNFKLILRNYKSNTDLWEFLRKQGDAIFKIKDWASYRRAVESTIDISDIAKTKSYPQPGSIFVDRIFTELSVLKRNFRENKDLQSKIKYCLGLILEAEDYNKINFNELFDIFGEIRQIILNIINNKILHTSNLKMERALDSLEVLDKNFSKLRSIVSST